MTVVSNCAAGHDVDDVEGLQRRDDDRRRDDRDRRQQEREDDPLEDLPFGGAVDSGRLEQLRADALEGGRDDDHGEAGPHPGHDDDQRDGVERQRVRLEDPWYRPKPERSPATALTVPVWAVPARWYSYMNFQITPAATMLIASGTKITDLATVSYRTRSTRTAMSKAEADASGASARRPRGRCSAARRGFRTSRRTRRSCRGRRTPSPALSWNARMIVPIVG